MPLFSVFKETVETPIRVLFRNIKALILFDSLLGVAGRPFQNGKKG